MFDSWETWQIVLLVSIICIVLLIIFYIGLRVAVNSDPRVWMWFAGLPGYISGPLIAVGIIQGRGSRM